MRHPLRSKKNSSHKVYEWAKAILIAFVILWIVRLFLFQTYEVNDGHMENALFKGDLVLVNKFTGGARIPMTLLSFPFFGNMLYSKAILLPYFRLSGTGSFSRGDMICFNYPVQEGIPTDKKTVMFKRLIAFPGDTLAIRSKKIFLNGGVVPDPETCKFRYRISFNNEMPANFPERFNILRTGAVFLPTSADLLMTRQQCDSVESDSLVKEVHLLKVDNHAKGNYFFPQNTAYSWTPDYWGPVVVPAKGVSISVSVENLCLYSDIIRKYEKNKLEIKHDSVFINDTLLRSYTFKMNYYAVLDDNRDLAKDSRRWGFLPEDHIIGKAVMVWFSADRSVGFPGIRWNRIFKKL